MRRPVLRVGAAAVLIAARCAAADIPMVGCPSDGQMGPAPAPKSGTHQIELDAKVADRLAFYKSDYDIGVLAPRGWHCANLDGSNGWMLFVAPHPFAARDFLGRRAQAVVGPAVQVSARDGGSSGRFEVAQLIARYFPAREKFLERVVAERLVPPGAFPAGPYPKDELVSSRRGSVEYITPPMTKGLGTSIWLGPNTQPIHSLAMVGGSDEETNSAVITVRLSKDAGDLEAAVLQDFRRRWGAP